MTTTSHPGLPMPESRPLVESCSQCGSPLTGPFCHVCGAEIDGPRLDPRTILQRTGRRLSWLAGRLFRTLLDLTIRPAQVGWIYLSGRRDRYIHPIPYALFAWFTERLVAWLLQALSGLLGRPGAALLIQPGAYAHLAHLPTLIVVVVIWRVFFSRSGYNLAEMLSIALYAFAHFIVLWTGFALVAGLLPGQHILLVRWASVLQLVIGLIYLTYVGQGIFRENALLVALKIGVSVAVPLEILAAIDSILSHR